MGADAYAYLYLGVKFDEVYKKGEDVQEYDLHDPKTGAKTGKKGQEKTGYYENLHTKEKFVGANRYDLPTEDFTHGLDQDSDEYIIGVQIAKCDDHGSSGHDSVSQEELEKAKAEFEKNVRPFCGNIQPELVLNLYWSY